MRFAVDRAVRRNRAGSMTVGGTVAEQRVHPAGRHAQAGRDRRAAGAQANALALSASNSAGLIVPASSSALASAMCWAGDLPATSRM